MHSIYPVTTFDSTITYPSTLYPSPQYTTGTTQQQLDGWAFFTSKALLHLPDWSNGAGRPAIILCHGRGGGAYYTYGAGIDSDVGDYTRALADAGFILIACDFGQNSWSNNLAMRVLDQAFTYVTAITGGTQVGLFGHSMGTNLALQWHRRHPDLVACSALFSAFADMDAVRSTANWVPEWTIQPGDPNYGFTYGANQTQIDNLNGAYFTGGSDSLWTANAIIQGHTPQRYPEQWRDRWIKFFHAAKDPLVPYQSSLRFVNAVNDPKCTHRLVNLSTATHLTKTWLLNNADDATVAAAGGLPRSEVRDYFLEHL